MIVALVQEAETGSILNCAEVALLSAEDKLEKELAAPLQMSSEVLPEVLLEPSDVSAEEQ